MLVVRLIKEGKVSTNHRIALMPSQSRWLLNYMLYLRIGV